MNVVTEQEGHASAVLLRALEPIQNIKDRTQGPGLLCRAMHIDKKLHGHDLLSDDFFIANPTSKSQSPFNIISRPRIGVDYAGDWAKELLRFYIEGNKYISKP
jgi:DNA-3-methyladenine glycosylase